MFPKLISVAFVAYLSNGPKLTCLHELGLSLVWNTACGTGVIYVNKKCYKKSLIYQRYNMWLIFRDPSHDNHGIWKNANLNLRRVKAKCAN